MASDQPLKPKKLINKVSKQSLLLLSKYHNTGSF